MKYDIVIIGAGPAGLTAAIYTGRAKLKTLLISDILPGGQTMLTEEIENYPGFPHFIKGPELINNIFEQAKKWDVEFKIGKVDSIEKKKDSFLIKTEKESIETLSTILATGASYKKLGVKGEENFTGKGVSYCGVCDAPLFRNKDISLVGGGDTAIYEASHLLKFVSRLHLIHRRDRLRATKAIQDRVLKDKKTGMHWNSVVQEIYGTKLVEGVRIKNIKTGRTEDIACKGIFIFVGIKPNSEFVKSIVKSDEAGFILTDENMLTHTKGIFACGDVRKKMLRQISTAIGDGASAAYSAQQYVEELKGIAYK